MTDNELLPLSILLIEDSEDTRRHLADVLKLYFKKVSSAIDGSDGLKKIKNLIPDVIISDIKMPGMNGIELLKEVKNDNYQPVVILCTAFSDKEYLLDALDMKVDAYLIKPIDISILIKKIKENINNIQIVDLKYKKLSLREYEVFLDIANGLKPSTIAQKYNIKPKTVSTYRCRIFEKMLFKTNAELIAYAIKNDLL